jgi:NADH-quinone oxidoreductase subunit E
VTDFLKMHHVKIGQILEKYPKSQERSAVMPLLHLAQCEKGHISRHDIEAVAAVLNISYTEVASIIGFYTLYHPENKKARYRIQVCTDLACALRGADRFLAELCKQVGIEPGETTPDGLISIEEVTCLAGCDRAPLFQVQGDGTIRYHENQTSEGAAEVINQLWNSAGKGGE